MTEKNIVIDALELDYEGIFDINDFLTKIDQIIKQAGYVKTEKRRSEQVFQEGKVFSIELRPVKRKNPDVYLMVKMRISVTGLQNTSIVRGDRKINLQKGKIHIIFDAWHFSTIEFRWEAPWFIFFKKLAHKALSSTHIIDPPGVDEVAKDCHYMYDNIRAFLNLYRHVEERR